MQLVFAAIAGALFGMGLLISGMTDTAKVQGWLDIFGAWDPTLAFVMGGAILPMALAWRIAARRDRAVLGGPLPDAPAPQLGRKLVLGSVMFGMGWGLVGLCPGPVVASLGYGGWGVWLFGGAMLGGMLLSPRIAARLDSLDPAG